MAGAGGSEVLNVFRFNGDGADLHIVKKDRFFYRRSGAIWSDPEVHTPAQRLKMFHHPKKTAEHDARVARDSARDAEDAKRAKWERHLLHRIATREALNQKMNANRARNEQLTKDSSDALKAKAAARTVVDAVHRSSMIHTTAPTLIPSRPPTVAAGSFTDRSASSAAGGAGGSQQSMTGDAVAHRFVAAGNAMTFDFAYAHPEVVPASRRAAWFMPEYHIRAAESIVRRGHSVDDHNAAQKAALYERYRQHLRSAMHERQIENFSKEVELGTPHARSRLAAVHQSHDAVATGDGSGAAAVDAALAASFAVPYTTPRKSTAAAPPAGLNTSFQSTSTAAGADSTRKPQSANLSRRLRLLSTPKPSRVSDRTALHVEHRDFAGLYIPADVRQSLLALAAAPLQVKTGASQTAADASAASIAHAAESPHYLPVPHDSHGHAYTAYRDADGADAAHHRSPHPYLSLNPSTAVDPLSPDAAARAFTFGSTATARAHPHRPRPPPAAAAAAHQTASELSQFDAALRVHQTAKVVQRQQTAYGFRPYLNRKTLNLKATRRSDAAAGADPNPPMPEASDF